jgi:NADH dehydrogenase
MAPCDSPRIDLGNPSSNLYDPAKDNAAHQPTARKMTVQPAHRVVVVGGGFGGLNLVQSLRRAPVQITLVDRRNFHLFQPLLYQVATGGLSPANIAAPLRGVLRKQRNVAVELAEAKGVDVGRKRLLLADGELEYDSLVVAAGATHSYFGRDQWEHWAPGLKTLEDALEIRRRIYLAFELAERSSDPATIHRLLTFVVVGAGPTGVEMAGALAEIAHLCLRDNFRRINPSDARILLVEGTDRVLRTYPQKLSAAAKTSLERLGVQVLTDFQVTTIDRFGVSIRGAAGERRIECETVVWAAGVAASPLGQALSQATGCALDRAGRVVVEKDLSLPGRPEIFVIGDLASCKDEAGNLLPGVAPVAIQQARYVAQRIRAKAEGTPDVSPAPFYYRDPGSMATIGRAAAVVHRGKLQISGFLAWLAWLFVHLMALVQFASRIAVLMQWAYSYITLDRSARLITGASADVPDHPQMPTGGASPSQNS